MHLYIGNSNWFCLKTSKNCYPQAFLKEYKYKIKEKEIKSFIEDDLESSSDDNSEKENNSE